MLSSGGGGQSKGGGNTFRTLLGTDDDEGTLMDEMNQQCTLSWTNRVWGFGICFALGLFCSILSAFFITDLVKFAILYTFGNILSLGSTLFLMGPLRQLKNMFHKKRVGATIVYLLAIIATILVAVLTDNVGLVILCMIIQFFAMMWYCLSYIPYGQKMVTNCCKGAIGL